MDAAHGKAAQLILKEKQIRFLNLMLEGCSIRFVRRNEFRIHICPKQSKETKKLPLSLVATTALLCSGCDRL